MIRFIQPFPTHRPDYALYLFLVCILLINGIYGVLNRNASFRTDFFKYTVFWLYNGCAIWTFRELADCHKARFFRFTATAAKANIAVQLLIFLLGKGRIFYEYWAIGAIGIAVSAALLLICIWPPADFDVHTADYNMITRIQDKIWRISYGGPGGLLLDRGLDKLALYPRYLLYGAGEGGFARFTLTAQIHEIHSCLPNILFCYGIGPIGILLVWLTKTLKTAHHRCGVSF